MRGLDQMPEDMNRTNELEREKSTYTPGRERIQAPEQPGKTDDIEKGKKENPGSL
jgi:hypothetical protein